MLDEGKAPAGEHAEFEKLLDWILEERGLDCRQYKPAFLQRRLATRMRACQASTFVEYQRRLSRDPAELPALFDALTISLTYFFRDPSAFDALRAQVLVPFIRERDSALRRRLRIWCAACASGEEPYSVAILLDTILGENRRAWKIEILGTDVDEHALQRAGEAVYPATSFSFDLDSTLLARYFRPEGKSFRLNHDIRSMVSFQRHNLLSDPFRSGWDLILCRNVLIYFTREQQTRVFRLLHQALRAGGYLMIGKCELLLGPAAERFEVLDRREHIFRKALDGSTPAGSVGRGESFYARR